MTTKYDWSEVPEDIKWLATDLDGVVNGFYEEPKASEEWVIWIAPDSRHECIRWSGEICLGWGESLEVRSE